MAVLQNLISSTVNPTSPVSHPATPLCFGSYHQPSPYPLADPSAHLHCTRTRDPNRTTCKVSTLPGVLGSTHGRSKTNSGSTCRRRRPDRILTYPGRRCRRRSPNSMVCLDRILDLRFR